MRQTTRGRCLCRAVRFAFDPNGVRWRAHCHCESCRRNCSAPFTTFFAVADTAWRWTGREPAAYASSPGVRRLFCPDCGSPMAYRWDGQPGETHFYAASLEDPSGFRPERHDFWSEKLPWIQLLDDLPRAD